MRALLDTHTFLWAAQGLDKISGPAWQALRGHELWLSYVSIWEMVIKHAQGKLRLPVPPVQFTVEQARENRIELLPVKLLHLQQLETLPRHHGDPFDRMLVAQAQSEDVALISCDAQMGRYDLRIIW